MAGPIWRHTVAIREDDWGRPLENSTEEKATGQDHWGRRLEKTTGENTWGRPQGKSTGENNWGKQLGKTTGENNWGKQLGKTTGENNYCREHEFRNLKLYPCCTFTGARTEGHDFVNFFNRNRDLRRYGNSKQGPEMPSQFSRKTFRAEPRTPLGLGPLCRIFSGRWGLGHRWK